MPDPTNGSYTNGSMSYDTGSNNYNPNNQSIGGGAGLNAIRNGKSSLLEGSYNEAQSH